MYINPLNAELNPICHLLALLGARHIFHVSGLRVKNVEFYSKNKFEKLVHSVGFIVRIYYDARSRECH